MWQIVGTYGKTNFCFKLIFKYLYFNKFWMQLAVDCIIFVATIHMKSFIEHVTSENMARQIGTAFGYKSTTAYITSYTHLTTFL